MTCSRSCFTGLLFLSLMHAGFFCAFAKEASTQSKYNSDSVILNDLIKKSWKNDFRQGNCAGCDSLLNLYFNQEVARKHPDFIHQAVNSAISCHKAKKDTLAVNQWLAKLYDIGIETKDESLLAWWKCESARIMMEANRYDSVMPFLLSALEIFQKKNSAEGLTLTCEYLGGVYYTMNDTSRSIYYHRKSLQYSQNEIFLKPIMLGNVSLFFFRTGKYDSAKYYMQETMKAEHKIKRETGVNYITLLRIEDKLGAPEDSLRKLFDQALKVNTQRKNYAGMMYGFIEYGNILLEKGRLTEAERILNQGLPYLDSCTGADYLDYRQRLYQPLSAVYDSMHDDAQCLKYLKLYDMAHKEFDQDGNKRNIEVADARYQADKQRQQLEFAQEHERAKQQFQKYLLSAGLIFLLVVALLIYRNLVNQKRASIVISRQKNEVEIQHRLSESLLLNILPEQVAKELKEKGNAKATSFENVTVLFSDFKDFTKLAERLTPQQLVDELHACFSAFDEIMGKYNIEKIKTVGDAYLAVSGLPVANINHAHDLVNAAIEVRDFMLARHKELGENTFEIRIGIHSGQVVAGIVGIKKFAYDIWGDTVNTAARMEQNSEAGKINISQITYELVRDEFNCQYRGEIEVKNKGMMKMYFVA